MAGIGTNNFWITAWLAFIPMMAGEVHCSTSVSADLNVRRAVYVQVSQNTTCTADLNGRFVLESSVTGDSSADTTYLSATRPVQSEAQGASDTSSSYLSRRTPIESSVPDAYSQASAHITLNPVDIDNLSVQQSSSVTGDLSRYWMLQSDIAGASAADGSIEAERGLFSDIECDSICSADANADYAAFSSVDCSSSCSVHLTVNPVELDGDVSSDTESLVELNRYIAVDSSVESETALDSSVDVTHTLRMNGSCETCSSVCWADMNKQGAIWSVPNPKSIVSATLNAVWDLSGLLTTAPLSNTKLTVILSARFETSVSITGPLSNVTVWLGKKHGVWSDVSGSSQVSGKITLNPVWITGLSVFGESQVSADLARNRPLVSTVYGASTIDASINKYGACWSVPNGFSSASVYLNRFGACWSDPLGSSSCSAKLNVYRAVSSDVQCVTSVDAAAWRMRNLQSDVQNASQVAGHVTVNLTPIVDATSTPASIVSGQLGVAMAVETTVTGTSAVDAEAWRKRNVEGVSQLMCSVTGTLNLHRAVWANSFPNTNLFVHLSRRFYTQGDLVDDKTVVTVYLSAIRPLDASSADGHSDIDATAWRMRNVVPDIIDDAWSVTGKLTLNLVPITDATSTDLHTLVSGELQRDRTLDATAVVCYSFLETALNAEFALWSQVECGSAVDVTLNAYHACDSQIDSVTAVDATLNAKRALYSELTGATETDAQVFRKRALFGDVPGYSSVQGKLSVNSVEIDGDSSGSSTASAELNRYIAVEASSEGFTLCEAEAFRKRNLEAVVYGSDDVRADLNLQIAVWGASVGDSALSGTLSILRTLYASSGGSSAVSGTLCVKYAVSAQSSGTTELLGELTFVREMLGYCPTETVVSAKLVKNIRELWAVSDANASSVSAELQRFLQFISVIYSSTQATADLNAWFALWSNLYPQTYVPVQFNARFALSSGINLSRSIPVAVLSLFYVMHGTSSGETDASGVLSAVFSVTASVDECRSDVSADLTINAKELAGAVAASTQVSADMEKLRVLSSQVTGGSTVDSTLSARHELSASCECSGSVTTTLNAKRACIASVSGISQVSGRADKMRAIHATTGGSTSVYAQVSLTNYPSAQVYASTDISARLSSERALTASVRGRSIVAATLGTRGVLFGGDPFAQFASTGGRHVVVAVKDTPPVSLPDWALVERDAYSLLSALVESIHLGISPDLVSDLTPLSMSPYHHCAVWCASVAQVPESVTYRGAWGLDTPVRRAESMYDLVHSPVPKWYWQDGRLYVSRLAIGMEQVNISDDRFELARPVRIDRRFPVYLVWSRSRGDLLYLLDESSLRFSSDRLVRIEPRFGYIIGYADSLNLGAHFDTYIVSGKAHPWLVFQTSSGGDSLPTCQPTIINLTKRGFVSIQIHADLVTLDRARGEYIYRAAEGSLSACGGSRGQLVGVFVGNTAPSVVPNAISPGNYSPQIGQVFPVEPGARYVVPSGATRLVLGILHDGSYSAGEGLMQVSVTEYDEHGSLSVLYTDADGLSRTHTLVVDGKSVDATALDVDTNPFYRWFRLLGGVLPFAGWNGFDITPYLQTAGVNGPVIPGIKPRVYEWDGISTITVSGYRVDVPGLAASVCLRFVMRGGHLPYEVDGRMLVNGRWSDTAAAGDEVQACVRLWSAQNSSPGVITVSPTANMLPLQHSYLVISLPYDILSIGVSLAPAGNSESVVFIWSDDVS